MYVLEREITRWLLSLIKVVLAIVWYYHDIKVDRPHYRSE